MGRNVSVVISARVRAEALGAARIALIRRGVRARSRSDLINLCVELTGGMLPEEEWPSAEQSLRVLDEEFPVKSNIMGVRTVGWKEERREQLREQAEREREEEKARDRAELLEEFKRRCFTGPKEEQLKARIGVVRYCLAHGMQLPEGGPFQEALAIVRRGSDEHSVLGTQTIGAQAVGEGGRLGETTASIQSFGREGGDGQHSVLQATRGEEPKPLGRATMEVPKTEREMYLPRELFGLANW